jgi:uncharacterized membrane protein YvlD (DUF360 family)
VRRDQRSIWVSTGGDVRDGLIGLLPTALAVLVAADLSDGLQVSGPQTALLVAVVVAAGDALLRPALRVCAARLGAIAALLLGVGSQVLLVWGSLALVPGARLRSPGAVLVTLVVVALIGAVTRWVIGVNDSSYLVGDLLRRARARRSLTGGGPMHAGGPPGLVVVQIDGLPAALLDHGIVAGTLPTLARWIRSGSHRATPWWSQVPATTPSAQAGLLHGSTDDIPAFRWYEKEHEVGGPRFVVANRPADAALIESRVSNGRGLLAGGGVSLSTMFSGDADTCQLVMSRAGAGAGAGLGPGSDYVRFFAGPFVFVRSLLLTGGELVKELWQARQQRIRRIEPRVHRGGSFAVARAITNALLRDLNVALVAEHMMQGAPVIFVDFVDYDEIAHHAGVARREAMDALSGLDRMLSVLEQVADAAEREYRFVVLSDHGQSQGPPFRQVAGHSLEEAVRGFVGVTSDTTVASTADAESWGPVNALLSDVLGAGRTATRLAQRRGGTAESGVLVGPQRQVAREQPRHHQPELVVVGSGNLGLIWFPRLPGRIGIERLRREFPRLLPGLLAEPGIGFVVVDSGRGPLVIGPRGVHVLADGTVEGADPLLPFGPRAAGDLARVAAMRHAPDVLVHSTLEPHTGEVHAFEDLVGCHGGLGGWQNLAVLVHPADWTLDEDLLDDSVPGERIPVGAVSIHRQLVRWLERAGTRAPVDEPSVPARVDEPPVPAPVDERSRRCDRPEDAA